jgi:hypothetical protein
MDSAAAQATGVLTFRAVTCTGNTYGVSSLKQHSLALNTCKVCALSYLARWLCRYRCQSQQWWDGRRCGLASEAHEVLRGCQV